MKHHRRPLPKPLGQPGAALVPARPPGHKAVVGRESVAEPDANHPQPPGNSLKHSLKLQKRWRRLTHHVLAAQEDEREKISHALQDDIAQTLFAINLRLLLLKQTARCKARGLKNQIASTQRLVVKSTTLVRRLARELDHHQPTPGELTVMTICGGLT